MCPRCRPRPPGASWLAALLPLLLLPGALHADSAPEVEGPRDEIIVTTQRVEQPLLEVPSAVSVVDRDQIQRAQPQLTLGESMDRIPGVFIQNRTNFAQDTRIAIRGFGARANFGIRGIKLIVDGIPATLPDGQGQVDSIDLASAGRIQVLRGPSGSLYGASSGGVILVTTEEPPETPFASARGNFGDYDFRSFQAKVGGQLGPVGSLLSVSHRQLDGYRDHSRMESLLLNGKFRLDIGERSNLTAVVNYLHGPEAQDPGGLTQAQVDADRRQARDANVLFDAGEEIDQAYGGLAYRVTWNATNETHISAHATWRDFANRLPFQSGGQVRFDRVFGGGAARHEMRAEWFGRPNRLVAGVEADGQRDDRSRFDNDFGTTGPLTLDQREQVTGVGVFLQDELDLGGDVTVTASGRYDWIRFDVEDRFLADGDDSGVRDFDQWSYMAAISWRPTDAAVPYFKIASSFETPTTTELANPSGGGFNPDLVPQKAVNFELGLRGRLAPGMGYELAGFFIPIRDELVPFEIAGMPGRIFFQNAGRSRRWGLEAGAHVELLPGLRASFAYAFSHFEFVDFGSASGNRTPGIPDHRVFAELDYEHPIGFFATWDVQYVDPIFADDANTTRSDAYVFSNLRGGYTHRLRSWEIQLFAGLNNLFDQRYTDNLRLNAFGERYFEPAPTFNAYGGLEVSYRFGAD